MTTVGKLLDAGRIEAINGFASGENNEDGIGTAQMRPFNVTPLGTVSFEQIKSVPAQTFDDRHLLRAGDILFNNTNTEELVGKTAFWSQSREACFSNHMTRVRVLQRESLCSRFLAFALHHHWQAGDSRMLCRRHVAQASILGERLREISIPDFEKPEQEKIAAVLWKIQCAIAIEEKLVATARELKQSTMRQLFTRGLRGERMHDTELGPLPTSWSAVPLGSFGHVGNGSTPLKTNPAYWTNGKIPWLPSAKVYDITIEKADQFVTQLAVDECHLPRVKPGSVLIAITGQGKTLGHAAVTAIETCINQHLAFVSFKDDSANPHFIRLFLETRYTELRGVGSGGGSTKGALTCGFLKTFLIPKPERAEQDEIASMLMTIEKRISVHERKRAALQELFKTMLHQLMTAQIRVHHLDIDTSEVTAC